MIDEGAGAPEFELPAVVSGEIEQVALSDYLGSDVVILAFYPADFNPACDGEQTDLDELDLFTMQKDVTILAISADSVYSHEAFADAYDLHIPLLTDTAGTVSEDYGVAIDDPQAGYRTKRGVVVIDPSGDVEYTWSTDDLRQLPPVDRVREAVDAVGGAETALARYRVGHAHYVEGRRAFTSAMGCFADEEWMMAQNDFTRAYDEFEEAANQFNTAARFGQEEMYVAHFERAEDKAELLWQAAEWLGESAGAYASGEGAQGQAMRTDAEAPLEEARRYGEPFDPDDFPPEAAPPPLEEIEDGSDSFLPEDEEDVDATLDVDFDEDAYTDDDLRDSVDASDSADETSDDGQTGATAESDGQATGPDSGEADAATPADETDDGEEAEPSIDDEELEEITAELEQQTEAAEAEYEREQTATADADEEEAVEPTDDGDSESPVDDEMGDEAGDEERADGEDVELDLTDPTEGEGLDPLEDEEEDDEEVDPDDDLGDDGGHGVPDSL